MLILWIYSVINFWNEILYTLRTLHLTQIMLEQKIYVSVLSECALRPVFHRICDCSWKTSFPSGISYETPLYFGFKQLVRKTESLFSHYHELWEMNRATFFKVCIHAPWQCLRINTLLSQMRLRNCSLIQNDFSSCKDFVKRVKSNRSKHCTTFDRKSRLDWVTYPTFVLKSGVSIDLSKF